MFTKEPFKMNFDSQYQYSMVIHFGKEATSNFFVLEDHALLYQTEIEVIESLQFVEQIIKFGSAEVDGSMFVTPETQTIYQGCTSSYQLINSIGCVQQTCIIAACVLCFLMLLYLFFTATIFKFTIM